MASDSFAPSADELVERNATYSRDHHDPAVPGVPDRALAVVTCMDSRLNVPAFLGLTNGEAHVLRNAGGVLTDDVVRSLCLSQRALGTREIVLVHHTRCGLHQLDESAFLEQLEDEVGERPAWPLHGFDDPYDDVRASIERLKCSPFLVHKDNIRGFVYDVDDGLLHPVT